MRLIGESEPVLTGFELARRTGSRPETVAGQVLGSPGYLAPERLSGQRQTETRAADIYSLGAIFYEMLAGEPPQGRTMREVVLTGRWPPQPPSRHQAGVPPALDAICLKALARDPAERYESMGEMAEALQNWLSPTGVAKGVTPDSTLETMSKMQPGEERMVDGPVGSPWHRLQYLIVSLAAVVLVGLIGMVGWHLASRNLPSASSPLPIGGDSTPPEVRPLPRLAPGLLVEYYIGPFDQPLWPGRIDRLIDINWAPPPGKVLPLRADSVRWTGFLTAPCPGKYRLSCIVDDAVSVWIDGKLVIDSWIWSPAYQTPPVEIELGSAPVPLEVKYFNYTGAYVLRLEWTKPGSSAAELVPAEALAHDPELAERAMRNEPIQPPPIPNFHGVLANWAHRLGGKVTIQEPGQPPRQVLATAALPAGPFVMVAIDLSSIRSTDPMVYRPLFRDTRFDRLSLANTRAGDDGIAHCLVLTLNQLDLSGAGVTDRLLLVQRDHRWATLRKLDLSSNRITDHGVRVLAGVQPRQPGFLALPGGPAPQPQLLELPALEELILKDTDVTNLGLVALQRLPRLKKLDLRGTKVTAEGVKAFRAMRSDCLVEF